MKIFFKMLLIVLASNISIYAQEYVNVTFRHYPIGTNVLRAYVPGTFNNWGPNSGGIIAPNAPSLMTFVDSLEFYVKTVRLRVGDTYNYKFHEHLNADGSLWQWYTDPLNPLINYNDNNNSILIVKNLMIFEMLPKNGNTVTDSEPTVVAGVFSRENDPILHDQSAIYLDDSLLTNLDGLIIQDISVLYFKLPKLRNGDHKVVISLKTQKGESRSDSTKFTVFAGDIFFYTPSSDSVWAGKRTIRWRINMGNTQLQSVSLYRSNNYSLTFAPKTNTNFEYITDLTYGENKFVVTATENSGKVTHSDTLRLFYPEPQEPQPEIIFQLQGKKIKVTAKCNDPQRGSVSYLWSTPLTNAAVMPGIDGRSDESFEIDIPKTPGDYSLKLEVTDNDGFSNSTINFFTINADSSVTIPNLKTVPSWVANARIYCMFIRSYTSVGTFQSARDNLEHIKSMGFNVIWVLPVMDVEGELDRDTNIGYNIINFYDVEPLYGTKADFKDFVTRAHELGLRVILDITPNHTSRSHPIALDVRSRQKFSRYYDFYQHKIIPHNDNGLGQYFSPDSIVYYGGFTSALLNWNWADAEARQYMIDVYTYWLKEFDIDGFRFDVYWGPHRKYGKNNFDIPLRSDLRSAKSDIMILGETAGTGFGSEVQYADFTGGLDLGYDWIFKDAVWNFPSINNLNSKLYNDGYRPGPNSFFLRFLENQDEDRVAYRYNSIEKTIPVSTAVFMATGIPLLYQGQEVGMGIGMGGDKDFRLRTIVDWKNPPARILAPHYQKVTQIRAQFPAFRRQMEDSNNDSNINNSDKNMQPVLLLSDGIYAFGRPFPDQNGIAVMNFTDQSKQANINLNLTGWAEFSEDFDTNRTYYLNNLYENTSQAKPGDQLTMLNVSLSPYEVVIYSISTKEETVELPPITVDVDRNIAVREPLSFQLFDNYPNPFNATTTIRYSLSELMPTHTSVRILNILGQQVKTVVNKKQEAGNYQITWDGLDNSGNPVSSGVYLYLINSGRNHSVKKLVLIK